MPVKMHMDVNGAFWHMNGLTWLMYLHMPAHVPVSVPNGIKGNMDSSDEWQE